MAAATRFTQRHYLALAAVLRDCWLDPKLEPDTVYIMIGRLAAMLQGDNPKFDRDKFYKAVTHD